MLYQVVKKLVYSLSVLLPVNCLLVVALIGAFQLTYNSSSSLACMRARTYICQYLAL
jgi:hypothetical protein